MIYTVHRGYKAANRSNASYHNFAGATMTVKKLSSLPPDYNVLAYDGAAFIWLDDDETKDCVILL